MCASSQHQDEALRNVDHAVDRRWLLGTGITATLAATVAHGLGADGNT